jgi:T4 superinfection immunity protein
MNHLIIAAAGTGPLAILTLMYFFPSVTAWLLKHHNASAIFTLNMFLGWTVIGWIGAFVWALTRPAPRS